MMATQSQSTNGKTGTTSAAPSVESETASVNGVRPSRRRGEQAAAVESSDSKPSTAKRTRVNSENAIRQTKRRAIRPQPVDKTPSEAGVNGNGLDQRAAKQKGVATRSATAKNINRSSSSDPEAVPAELLRQFVQVGRKYYFPDGARAFTDRGHKLTTPSENTEVVRSLISIAQARGWQQITVTGTERFRKEAWFAAKLSGLAVKGYQPTQFEQGHLVRTAARASLARDGVAPNMGRKGLPESDNNERPTQVRNAATERRDGLITGRLIDHGRATYHHDPHEPVSYFVKVETPRGERTLWGVDFERAFRQSLTKPEIGDYIGLRAVRQEAVTVKTREHDSDGKVLNEKDLTTHRNRWIVEKESFYEIRAAAAQMVRDPKIDARKGVREHPELAGTYLYLKGAKEVAQRRIRDPEDQRKFVATVRNALADAVARGEPLPPVRLRNRTADRASTRSTRSAERESAPVRG
jgi:Large polyvalent protein-associated domain 7